MEQVEEEAHEEATPKDEAEIKVSTLRHGRNDLYLTNQQV